MGQHELEILEVVEIPKPTSTNLLRGQFLILSYCASFWVLLTAAIQQMIDISRREPI